MPGLAVGVDGVVDGCGDVGCDGCGGCDDDGGDDGVDVGVIGGVGVDHQLTVLAILHLKHELQSVEQGNSHLHQRDLRHYLLFHLS